MHLEGILMQDFDFDNALTMHRAWKMKFHIALGRVQGEDFDTRPLGDPTQCDLGRWLTANAAELRDSPAVANLLPVHEEFHRQSKSIADAIREGHILHMSDSAIGAYLELSSRIEALLLTLKQELQPAA
jgi:hypothetical protein